MYNYFDAYSCVEWFISKVGAGCTNEGSYLSKDLHWVPEAVEFETFEK